MNITQRTVRVIGAAWLLMSLSTPLLEAQQSVKRIMALDSTLNNLVDPPGYETAKPGTLGGILRAGNRTQAMILIPGLDFSGSVFTDFMDSLAGPYRMYAVTLPGDYAVNPILGLRLWPQDCTSGSVTYASLIPRTFHLIDSCARVGWLDVATAEL